MVSSARLALNRQATLLRKTNRASTRLHRPAIEPMRPVPTHLLKAPLAMSLYCSRLMPRVRVLDLSIPRRLRLRRSSRDHVHHRQGQAVVGQEVAGLLLHRKPLEGRGMVHSDENGIATRRGLRRDE